MSEARAARVAALAIRRGRGAWPLLAAAVAANVVLVAVPVLEARAGALWLLAGALPAILSERLLLAEEADRLTRSLVGVGLAFVWLILGALLLHYLPGPLSRFPILSAYNLGLAGLTLAGLSRGAPARAARGDAWPRAELVAFASLLLLAALTRLVSLGYSEFQGDEVAVMSKAAAVVQGRDDALFYHKKGPAEILLPALVYAVGQQMTEAVARLPFAVAEVAALATLYAIVRSRSAPWAAGWALALAVGNGFFVAFGRIVQYQSLVLLFSALALLCALRYVERHRPADLWLCALFLAVGLLAHSDAALALPACAGVILTDYRARRASRCEVARDVSGPVALAAVALGLFYAPFALHGHFGATRNYLLGRLGTPPVNNLGHIATIGTAYNAIYLLAFIAAVLGIAGTVHLARRAGGSRWAWGGVALSLAALALAAPERWHVAGRDLSALAFLPPITGLLLARSKGPAWRGAALWFTVPFVAYVLLVEDPRTHVYTLFPGASLLVGMELAALGSRLSRTRGPEGVWPRLARVVAGAVAGAVLVASCAYAWIAFVGHVPEYQRTYPKHRQALFWTPFGDEFPEKGLFGYPYRAGWKAIGALYAQGVLRGDLGSNEEAHIVGWYTRGQPYCGANPRYVALAENVQDEQPVSEEMLARDYDLVGRVRVRGEVRLRLYERRPAQLVYRDYDVEEYAAPFDRLASGPYYPSGLPAADPLAEIQEPAALRLGDAIEFLGHSVSTRALRPGEPLVVTLYWRARVPVPESYTAFVHMEDPGVVWAQKDTPPGCGASPTNRWQVGEVHADRYVLVPAEDTPPGDHLLVAGMYRATTGERLPVLNADDYQVGTVLDLGTVAYAASGG